MCRGWGNYLWSSCKKLRCNSKTDSWGDSSLAISSWQACSLPWHGRKQAGYWFSSSSAFSLRVGSMEVRQLRKSSQPRKTAAQKTVALPQVIWLCLLPHSISLSKVHPTNFSFRRSEKQMEFKCANVTYNHNSWNTQILQFVKTANEKNPINKLLSGVINIFTTLKCKEYGNISVCII